jgi:transposase-like protein
MISIEAGLTPTGRRSFPIGFRLEFLREWDACRERGAKTRLLRENDLPHATVVRWLKARRRGELEESMTKASKPGRSSASVDRAELARLRVENERLRRQVVQAEAAQDILGKAFELLQGINESSDSDPQIPPALMSAAEYADWLKRTKLS